MKKNIIVPTLTFVIGGGIGAYAGAKVFATMLLKYLRSDEYKAYINETLDKVFDELDFN